MPNLEIPVIVKNPRQVALLVRWNIGRPYSSSAPVAEIVGVYIYSGLQNSIQKGIKTTITIGSQLRTKARMYKSSGSSCIPNTLVYSCPTGSQKDPTASTKSTKKTIKKTYKNVYRVLQPLSKQEYQLMGRP